jgi:flagellin
MDVLGSAGQVELNLSRTQLDEERQVRALASGLRVISASDDPSGLAISENIQTQILGLQQGVQNVQNARNLLDVADSALANVQEILQRVHTLIVQASSDLNSVSNLQMIQAQIDQLLQEVNKIAGSANFNGVSLLNGSLSNSAGSQGGVYLVNSGLLPDGSAPTGSNVVNFNGLGQPGALVGDPNYSGGSTFGNPTIGTLGSINAYVSIQVTGYSANAVDPDSGTAVGPGDYITITAYSTDSKMGAAPLYVDTSAVAVNAGPIASPGVYWTSPSGNPGNVLLQFGLANLTPQDVGASMTFETFAPQNTTSGKPLQVNSSGNEGGDLQISLPSVTTTALNVSGISVMGTTEENYNDQVVGSASNQIPTEDAEARVGLALDSISAARATIGAQTVSLQEEANDASLQVVNQIASESAIRDVDMGQTMTKFTMDQVLSQIGTSVLAQMQSNAQLVVQLVSGVSPGTTGKV